MRYRIVSDLPGRLRVKLPGRVPSADRGALYAALLGSVEKLTLYPRAGSIAVHYRGADARQAFLARLAALDAKTVEEHRGATTALSYQQRPVFSREQGAPDSSVGFLILWQFAGHLARRVFLPTPLRAIWTLASFVPFARAALRSLVHTRLDVSVLDAASIVASSVQGDFNTAGQTMLLLNVGDTLEEYTRRRSENELLATLLERSPRVVCVEGDRESELAASSIRPGDLIVVRTGLPINVDGVIERGSAWVNQASLTGEPYPIERVVGDSVFAGTVVEEGELFVRVRVADEDTRLRTITSLVRRSEVLKSDQQLHMERAAERIVPWNFALAAATGILTRDFTRASAALMVDYSCVLKMGGSIAVLSAMRDAAKLGFTVKGARFFEAYAAADTMIFDKTGTLTQARPELKLIIPVCASDLPEFCDEREVLRLAACLEEHFPHPLARAVVRAAEERGVDHRERHAEVEYLVAHGIASSLEGRRVVIGSAHFLFGDEGVAMPDGLAASLEAMLEGLTPLYLAVDHVLVGVLGIADPLKEGAAATLKRLRALGFRRFVMLTGDNHRSASRVAAALGVEEFHADLLPDEKFAIVEDIVAEGSRVVMVGDGVNDSPALARADVGIALGQGTAIAREVADITFADDDLEALVTLRHLSEELKERLSFTSRSAIGFNSAVMAGGVAGLLPPGTASLLHNSSTVALCLKNAAHFKVREGQMTALERNADG
ncbi:MAG: heavy metal translocating P-type ATPase [Coriobacteriales bacterium]|jgi:heavy metal translocating P-type ATPase|nr:heavy metal translocating P-type ATPase [Coriobacteriales bacterium]